MCNTFTVHHKANRLLTQRHIVKTDVWLSWASRGVTFLISDLFINLNIKRSDKSDSEIRFVRPLLLFKRGSLQMAKSSCWLIVSILWTGVKLVLQVTSCPGAQRAWICFIPSVNFTYNSSSRKQIQTLTDPGSHLHPTAQTHSLVGAWGWGLWSISWIIPPPGKCEVGYVLLRGRITDEERWLFPGLFALQEV